MAAITRVDKRMMTRDTSESHREVVGEGVDRLKCSNIADSDEKENIVGDPVSANDQNIVNLRRLNANRRSLRSSRCQSTAITEKEKTLLMKQDKKMNGQDGKGASKGFVKSMCRFYSDIIGDKRKTLLDRSVSFSIGKDKVVSMESISERGSSEQCLSSPVSSRSGSFRLNRSRSWRGSRRESLSDDTPKRNSPTGQSVRSQDSGFSDSGEPCHVDIDLSYESPPNSICQTNKAEPCDQRKPYVTKINIDGSADNQQSRTHSDKGKQNADNFLYEVPRRETIDRISYSKTGTTPVARERVTGSLGNIVSLQEGLKIKLETEPRTLYNQGYDANKHFQDRHKPSVTPIHNNQTRDKLRQEAILSGLQERPTDQNMNLSQNDNVPLFSTPVRASFRRRPQTMICLDEAHTPVKRESRTRLKEIKSRRRWSNIDQDQSKLSPLNVNTTNIKNSGSQYRNNLNADACYEFRNQERRNSNLSPSMTALSQISPVESYPGPTIDRTQQSLDLHSPQEPNLGQSFNVDGTGTRLMIESFINQSAVVGKSQNTIFPSGSILTGLHSDTIIEHESSVNAPCQYLNKTQDPQSVAINNQSSSNRTHQDPVYEWWKDLFIWTEPECMTYLQSKPILKNKSPISPKFPLAYYPYETIRSTLENKRGILVTFNTLKSHFSALNLLQMNKTIGLLTKQIKDFIYEHNLWSYSDPLGVSTMSCVDLPGFKSSQFQYRVASPKTDGLSEIIMLQEKAVLQVVDRLKLCAHRCQYTPNQPLVEMKKAMKHLEEQFNKFCDLIITREVKYVIGILENPMSDSSVVDAINMIINLGNEHSSQIYSIITKVGAIRSLISLAISSTSMEVKLLSLRAISSICCTIESVRELEQCKGIETISDILVNYKTSLTVKVEAAGVLAQITSPWISDNHSIAGLKEQVPTIVDHLTRLARIQAGDDTFLLVSAALANLTFMESQAVISMQTHGTAKALMKVVNESPFTSLFARDQVVTVIANLATKEDSRQDILAEDGLCFLISLLSTNPENTQTPAETAAAERVLKKTAIALSRLCCVPAVCEELINLRGLDILVALCKDGSLRNFNDAVLVACLAVLRRVANHCGHQVFDELEARDLIDPKLMDSFLEYSSKQESYV